MFNHDNAPRLGGIGGQLFGLKELNSFDCGRRLSLAVATVTFDEFNRFAVELFSFVETFLTFAFFLLTNITSSLWLFAPDWCGPEEAGGTGFGDSGSKSCCISVAIELLLLTFWLSVALL